MPLRAPRAETMTSTLMALAPQAPSGVVGEDVEEGQDQDGQGGISDSDAGGGRRADVVERTGVVGKDVSQEGDAAAGADHGQLRPGKEKPDPGAIGPREVDVFPA